MNKNRVIIIGAGLAGLTAGRVLGEAGADYTILERSCRPGGLCRSENVDGFTFDYTGHLLHLKEGESRELILEILGDELEEHARRASICIDGTFVPYPIQAHFCKLPAPLAGKCMEDLIAVSGNQAAPDMSFPDWARAQFGDTLAGIFMIPYNRKLYVHPLEEMEVSWTSWSVPKPTLKQIEDIAAGLEPPAFGYNATFFYPRDGGIETLPKALCSGQEDRIRTTARVVHIDITSRTVTLDSGEVLYYRYLVNTMPLPDFIGICKGLSRQTALNGERLRHSSVLGICLGLDGPIVCDDHWIYFPDDNLPFYRIGFPSNFSGQVAPDGCGSLYAEFALAPGEALDGEKAAETVLRTLHEYGLTERSTRAVGRIDLKIPCAYVFHDRHRARRIESLKAGLRSMDILSVGRYGAWEYSGMQEAIDWGLLAAREVLS